jgi:hypothetical protein
MIELEPTTDEYTGVSFWHDVEYRHVIVLETEDTARLSGPGPGWYVRDENDELGPFNTFEQALFAADDRWLEISLAPANRLRETIETGRADEVGHFLLEYLADYGAVWIDVQELATRVFERVGGDEEAWQ